MIVETREQYIAFLCQLCGREDLQASLVESEMSKDQVRGWLLKNVAPPPASREVIPAASQFDSLVRGYWADRRHI
jgi:hypothetical protein